MPEPMPAISLSALPGRRRVILELAAEAEARGFAGIYLPSLSDNMALAGALALATNTIPFGTSIAPIYLRSVVDFANNAAFIHELSGGRFRFGIGVSHGPTLKRIGAQAGKPLADIRKFVADFHAVERTGDKPPVVLAALRQKMIALASEIAQGMVFANGARSHMPTSLKALPAGKATDDGFFIGNMIPTCIADDEKAAAAVNRRTLSSYALLPNYRNYWKEAGYVEEMAAIEKAVAAGETARVGELLSDRWLADTTLFGPVAKVREGVEKWRAAGIRTPILVPSSAAGNQLDAIRELFAAFAR